MLRIMAMGNAVLSVLLSIAVTPPPPSRARLGAVEDAEESSTALHFRVSLKYKWRVYLDFPSVCGACGNSLVVSIFCNLISLDVVLDGVSE